MATLLTQQGAAASMSRRGNCYDHARMERFRATLKAECFAGEKPPTRQAAKLPLFDYIEGFYTRPQPLQDPRHRRAADGSLPTCEAIKATVLRDEDGDTVFATCWEPTPEEIAALGRGEPVWLYLWAKGLPPAGLSVGRRPFFVPQEPSVSVEEVLRSACKRQGMVGSQAEQDVIDILAGRPERTVLGSDSVSREGSFPKAGSHSAGGQRQDGEVLGKKANLPVGREPTARRQSGGDEPASLRATQDEPATTRYWLAPLLGKKVALTKLVTTPKCAGVWSRITVNSKRNSAWTNTRDEAGRASTTMWPWALPPSFSCTRSKPGYTAVHKRSLPPTLRQVYRSLQAALIHLSGRCPWCQTRF